ncbi:MAG: energy transducer TonB [Pirellulaceae bacterium]|nr:energy transducer TonB [Pirellulaceae bacterium]
MRWINRLLGRPSVCKATLWSLTIHVGSFSAGYCWWSEPVEQASFAGQRQTVCLEASFSAPQPVEQVEFRLEVDPLPEARPTELVPDREPPLVTEIALPEMPLAKSQVAVLVERPADREVELFVEVGEPAAPSAAASRHPSESVEAEMRLTPAPARLQKSAIAPPTPQSTMAVRQIAGVEDKEPPDFSGNLPPSYPAEAVRRRLEGTVMLRLHIAATGRVVRVEVLDSSGHAVLDRAAVQAVSKWRGRPAQQSGLPVSTVESLSVRFRL